MGAIVITGSTRGIGFGLAGAFLARGCSVVVSGRTQGAVDEAWAKLGAEPSRLIGVPCDVTSAADLQALWERATEAFGSVDVWINNAGTCNAARAFADLDASEVTNVIDTNMRGAMLGSHVAVRGLLRQGRGKLFNMEGWGSRGEWSRGLTAYGATKRALRYFTDALVRETRDTPIQVGTLSPGMVATDLLISSWEHGLPENWLRMKWLFHFVIDPPEPVCGWLAEEVLGNRITGAHYTWMSPLRLLSRFFRPYYWRRNVFAGTALERIGT